MIAGFGCRDRDLISTAWARYRNGRPRVPVRFCRHWPVFYEGERTLSRYPLSLFSMLSLLQLLMFLRFYCFLDVLLVTIAIKLSSSQEPYIDCRQDLSSGSISKRTPQVSGRLLKVLAGDVPTRTKTVLLSTFLDNQSPFLFCIVIIPF